MCPGEIDEEGSGRVFSIFVLVVLRHSPKRFPDRFLARLLVATGISYVFGGLMTFLVNANKRLMHPQKMPLQRQRKCLELEYEI
jgi:hypothetical protein